jgi:predicted MPP superfamily phosphohydrolase
MRRRVLGPPEPAAHDPRAHFNPKSGWFRTIERKTSLFLSRHVWPRLPLGTVPYSIILDNTLTAATTEIPIPGLPSPLDGMTILFISDIHAGPFLSPRALASAFKQLAALRPDLVIHGGDLATSNVAEVLPHAGAVSSLSAPLGVFAVYGNHDHYTGELAALDRFYASCGVRVMNNTAVTVTRGGAVIALAGIDDWNIGRPDLDGALSEAHRIAPDAPVILISHNPDAALEAASRGVPLTLSGHTHGGQVRIPGRPVLVRMSRYRLDDGRYVHEGRHIVVSRGLGVSGIPLRIACQPEALFVTLRDSPLSLTNSNQGDRDLPQST